jgi:cyclic pyranopterin phosphate synthase
VVSGQGFEAHEWHLVGGRVDVSHGMPSVGFESLLTDHQPLTTTIFTMSELTHFDEQGASRMVDTTAKPETHRLARASGLVRMNPATLNLIKDRSLAKGDVLEVARLGGIMAAKKTGDLIPLCHPLPITSARVDFSFPADDLLRIEATVQVFGRTGVEMEALSAVSISALTVYDMCKAVDKTMTIELVRLEEKTGGRSGTFTRSD